MNKNIKTEDIMTREVPAVSENDQIARIRNIILKRNVDRVLVYDGELKGILTEGDIARAFAEERRGINEMRAREIMTRSLITSNPKTKPEEIAKTMMEKKISSVPILRKNEIHGIVTKKDLVKYCVEKYPGQVKVKDIMTEDVVIIKEQQSIFQAAREMEENNISRIVVVRDKKPVGIITDRDISLATQGANPSRVEYTTEDDEGIKHKRRKIYPMIASDIMQENLETIEPQKGISKAGEKMLQRGVSSLVIQEKGELKGIITKTDIVKYLAEK